MVTENLQIFRPLASELDGDTIGALRKVAARTVFSLMQANVAAQCPAPSRGEAPVGSASAEHFAHHRGRIRQGALPVADQVVGALRGHPAADRVEVAGSLRRLADSVKDIDIIATASDPAALAGSLRELPIVDLEPVPGEIAAVIPALAPEATRSTR